METLVVTESTSREAQKELQIRIGRWLTKLVEFPGYREWKNKQIVQTLIEGHVPGFEQEELPDFKFPLDLENEIALVRGYHAILSGLISIRECEFYFRRYPFGNRNVSREAHFRTCCELFLSRVYQFKQRWLRLLKWLNRRTKPKGIPIGSLEQEFDRRFGNLLAERHKIHHEEEYSDIQVQAVGLGDLLSLGGDMPDWLAISRGSYVRMRREWVKKVRSASEQLDLFVGVVATLMLPRCQFLPNLTDGPQPGKSPIGTI